MKGRIKASFFSTLQNLDLEKTYRNIQYFHLEKNAANIINSSQNWIMSNGEVYQKSQNSDKPQKIQTIQHPFDQGAILCNQDMILELVRKTIKENPSTNNEPSFGYVTRCSSKNLFFKKSNNKTINLMELDQNKSSKYLGEEGSKLLEEYKEMHHQHQKNNNQNLR